MFWGLPKQSPWEEEEPVERQEPTMGWQEGHRPLGRSCQQQVEGLVSEGLRRREMTLTPVALAASDRVAISI